MKGRSVLTSLNVAVIDYDAGNTLSVTRALERVGARVDLTPDPEHVARAHAVVLPGVGAFGDCVRKLGPAVDTVLAGPADDVIARDATATPWNSRKPRITRVAP